MTKLRAILKRQWWVLLITTIVGLVGGAVSSQVATSGQVKQLYTASQVVVASRDSNATPFLPQDALKVTRGQVPTRAAEILGIPGQERQVATTIDTKVDDESGSLTISSNDTDPAKASKRVDAFVEAFLEITNSGLQADTRRDLANAESDLAEANADLEKFDTVHPQITGDAALPGDVGTQLLVRERQDLVGKVDQATRDVRDRRTLLEKQVPYSTLGPEAYRAAATGLLSVPTALPVRTALIGFLGLLLGGVVATVVERVSRRIDTRDELVDAVDLPILAEIGFIPEKRRHTDDGGALLLEGIWSEPYRRIRSAIQFVQAIDQAEPQGQIFLVTSTSPGEGKSTSSAMIARALAEVGTPTVVVGGDFRKPEVDHLLGVERVPSLQDLAKLDVHRATVDDVVQQTRQANLYVAAAGPATREVAGLIDAAKEVSLEATRRGATVIIDSSPIQAANDTVDLLPVADFVILVVRAGRTTESSMLDAIDTLRRMNSTILGVVLIGTRSAGRAQSYYYDYYNPEAAATTPQASAPSDR